MDVSRLIQGLGLSNDILYSEMSSLTAKEKVKVLLAQALTNFRSTCLKRVWPLKFKLTSLTVIMVFLFLI